MKNKNKIQNRAKNNGETGYTRDHIFYSARCLFPGSNCFWRCQRETQQTHENEEHSTNPNKRTRVPEEPLLKNCFTKL